MGQDINYKYYVAYDVKGRKIPGSGILRKSMPKNGRWEEQDQNVCCNTSTTTTSTSTTTTTTATP